MTFAKRIMLIISIFTACLLIAIISIGAPKDVPVYTLNSMDLTRNISENLTRPLFEFFSSPANFTTLHRENETVPFLPTYFISGESICLKTPYRLLVVVPSTVSHRDRRDVIRQTWASMVYQGVSAGNQRQIVRLAFFFGDSSLNATQKSNLQQEASTYNDIVVANFHDAYRNLSLKMLIAISWAGTYCSHAPFVMKVDDDVFLNIELLLYVLSKLPKVSLDFNFGFKNIYDRPPVFREGRWRNSESDYPLPYYPPYVVGYAYVLSKLAVQRLIRNFHRFHIINNEDAFINGVIASSLNITRFHSNAFSSPVEEYTHCDVAYNRFVAFHAKAENLISVWQSFRSKKCSQKTV